MILEPNREDLAGVEDGVGMVGLIVMRRGFEREGKKVRYLFVICGGF